MRPSSFILKPLGAFAGDFSNSMCRMPRPAPFLSLCSFAGWKSVRCVSGSRVAKSAEYPPMIETGFVIMNQPHFILPG